MSQPRRVGITMLNSMAGSDLAEALDRHVAWGIEVLDLKDGLFGKAVMDLTDAEAGRVAAMARERSLSVYCLSTGLFGGDLAEGRSAFEARHLGRVERAIELADILQPRLIRLLVAQSAGRGRYAGCMEHLRADHPWLVEMYGRAADRIHAAGFGATIENEVDRCLFRTPEDAAGFFEALGRPERVLFTWDVQNLWQMGAFPTVEAYELLRGAIGYVHLKGGQCRPDEPGGTLLWRSGLSEASWPVADIVRRVVADGVSEVICLNPSHGQPRVADRWDDFTEADLDFLRATIAETAP